MVKLKGGEKLKKKELTLTVVCIILLVVSIGSNLWFWASLNQANSEITSLETMISTKSSEIENLEASISTKNSVIDTKNSEIETLESEVTTLQTDKSSLESQVDSLNSKIENLTAIINMEVSTVWVNNESLIYPPDSYRTWSFSAEYSGLVLVRVEMILPEGYAQTSNVTEIQVSLLSKQYISREGTLHLRQTSPISTALIPVADLTYPVDLQITVRNISSDTVRLAVTITYVY